MNTNIIKTILASLLFLESFLFSSISFLPQFKSIKSSSSKIGLMNCYTSGLFFAMGINHIFREANEELIDFEQNIARPVSIASGKTVLTDQRVLKDS